METGTSNGGASRHPHPEGSQGGVREVVSRDVQNEILQKLRLTSEEQVRLARHGVEKAKHLRPDLVVMDIVMPVSNGIEASRLLKRLLPNMLIVIFSTFADTHIEAAALAAGAHAVVNKSEGASLIGNIQQLFAAGLSSGYAA